MTVFPSRIRYGLCLLLALTISALLPTLAAGAGISGAVQAEGLPQGSAVRATRTTSEGIETRFASVGEDGAFSLSEMAEGEWTLEVVTADGQLLPAAEGAVSTVTVPASGVVETTVAVTVPSDLAKAGAASAAGGGGVKPWVTWTVVGVVVAAAAVALATTGGGEVNCVPSVSPAVVCP